MFGGVLEIVVESHSIPGYNTYLSPVINLLFQFCYCCLPTLQQKRLRCELIEGLLLYGPVSERKKDGICKWMN